MARRSTLDLNLNLSTSDARKNMDDFEKAVEDGLNEAVNSSFKLGPRRSAKIQADLKDLQAALVQSSKQVRALEAEWRRTDTTAARMEELKTLKELAHVRFQADRKRWDEELKFFERRKEAEKDASVRFDEALGKSAQNFGDHMHGVFADIASKDIGILAGLFGKLAKANQAVAQKASFAGAGKEGSALGGIGKALTSIGPALVGIAALAAGLAVVAKIFIDMDTQAKEFNKNLLESGVAGAALGRDFKDLEATLTSTRNTFMAFSFNKMWGTTSKDLAKIIGEYEEAGFLMSEMKTQIKGAASEQDNLRKSTEAVLTYTKLLGVPSSELTKNFSTYMEELGTSLAGVQTRFSGILSVARESGFGVKRFFSMISQATSGMSLYNVRLEEAVSLLSDMGKALGQEKGGEMVKSLAEGFKNMSPTDAIKRVHLMGQGRAMGLSRAEGGFQAGEFMRKVGEVGATAKGAGLPELLEKRLGGSLTDPAILAKLGKASQTERDRLASEIGDFDAGLGRMITSLGDLSAAIQKGGEEGAAAALAQFGPQSTLLAEFDSLKTVLGKSIGELSDADLKSKMAYLNTLGYSVEQLRNLQRADRLYIGRQEKLVGAQMAALGDSTNAVNFNLKHARETGVAIGEGGEGGGVLGARYKAVLDSKGGLDKLATFSAEAMGDTKEELVRQIKTAEKATVSEDIALARQIAANTADFATIMAQGTEAVLNRIYTAVSDIRNYMSFGRNKDLSADQIKAKDAALAQTEKQMTDATTELIAIQKERLDIEKKMASASPEEKASFEARLKELDAQGQGARDRRDISAQARARIQRMTKGTDVRGDLANPESFLASAYGGLDADPNNTVLKNAQTAGELAVAAAKKAGGSKKVLTLSAQGRAVSESVPLTEKDYKKIQDEAFANSVLQQTKADKALIEPAAEANAEAMMRKAEEQKTMDLTTLLAMSGMSLDEASLAASGLRSSNGGAAYHNLSPEARKMLEGRPDLVSATAVAHDFIVSDGRLQRIDNADDLIGFKRGGPIANASGGNQVNNISLIGAGPRDLLNGLYNAMKAGVVKPGMA